VSWAAPDWAALGRGKLRANASITRCIERINSS
jgi:hypothetical protein